MKDSLNMTVSKPEHAWFEEARFGLFIHWGLYSQLGHENAEWVLFKSNIERLEYNRLAEQFRADKFDADAWAALAKRAGMNYMVLTTRHHDGFCLFDTQTTDFNSVKTAAKRDFVAEYVEACRRAGLRVGLYYSIMSWQQPAIYGSPEANPEGWKRMVDETHAQLEELMTRYGKIDELWYDGAVVPGIQDNGMQARYWRSVELNAMIRRHQPDILINDRSGLPEDFSTPEQHVRPPEPGRRWEACMTINQSWGYNIHDRNFKSPEEIIKTLIRCSRYGGNLLLNIGPRGDGSIQRECAESLERVGEWLKVNGDAIYGSRRISYTEADHLAGPSTWRNGKLYVHLPKYAGPTVLIDGVGEVDGGTILGNDVDLVVKPYRGNSIEVSGLSEDMFESGPAVLVLTPKRDLTNPARLLGGGDELRIEAGNAPVLCDDPDRFAPPVEPVRTGDYLAELVMGEFSTANSDEICPGWKDWKLFYPTKENKLELSIDVPVNGCFTLELGALVENGTSLSCSVDDGASENCSVKNLGVPDTWAVNDVVLSAGRHDLTVESDGRFAIYAFRLVPIWRPIPSEYWWAVGPFPTQFGPQRPWSEVRDALEQVFPPEKEYDLDAKYAGAGGRDVSWVRCLNKDGEHSDCGVNFPYQCGTRATGVCYARTTVTVPEDCETTILVGGDWWLNVWVDGVMALTERNPEEVEIDGAQFSTWKPAPAKVKLKKGENVILVKCHPGTNANWFTFRISDVGDLKLATDA